MKLVEEWNQETKSVIEDLLNSEIQNPSLFSISIIP
jgi:hypothetical protein